MKLHTLCALLSLLALHVIGQELVTWKCTNSPMACENFCYATNCRGVRNEYQKHNRGKAESEAKRAASGVSRNPCNDLRRKTYWCQQYGKCHDPPIANVQADEWPAARLEQGGTGAWLRCIDGRDNQSGGQAGKYAKGTHSFALTNLDYPGNVFCGPNGNDGDCGGTPQDLYMEFRFDANLDRFVDYNGNLPMGDGEPVPVEAPTETPPEEISEDERDEKLKVRRRSAREILSEMKSIDRRDISTVPVERYLTSRGTILHVPRHVNATSFEKRSVVWEADDEESYIITKL